MRVRVKICGITNAADALAAVEAGADALGFIFAPSRRQVAPTHAAAILRELPPFVTTVGVVVDQDVAEILADCPLDAIQFHGSESPEAVASVAGVRRIKALRVGGAIAEFQERVEQVKAEAREAGVSQAAVLAQLDATLRRLVENVSHGFSPAEIRDLRELETAQELAPLAEFAPVVDAVLLDTYTAGAAGGTGQTFPWGIAARAAAFGRPVIIAGGLTPENVGEAIRQAGPYGVDVAGGVESAPGRKDHEKLRAFIAEVAQASLA